MALTLIILSLLVLGLGLFQAWTLWLMKREIARLDQRLDESLDDQDLLDFQERLQGLLNQARSAGTDMVSRVEKRQDALEKTLTMVREAEKKLVARAELIEKAADAIGKRAEKLMEETGEKKAKRLPERSTKSRPKAAAPETGAEAEAEEDGPAPVDSANARKLSYLARPAAIPAQAPASVPAPAPSGRYQKIYEWADQGLSRDQIAKESGVLPGEVELILNLRPRRKG